MKCTICKEDIKELFLGKIKGTYVFKEGSSKKYPVCFSCQKKFPQKSEIVDKL